MFLGWFQYCLRPRTFICRYMKIIKMFQNLLTVVKRWHLFSTDEFIRLQTKDQCYFAFSEFGTETTLTVKCMHDN